MMVNLNWAKILRFGQFRGCQKLMARFRSAKEEQCLLERVTPPNSAVNVMKIRKIRKD